MLRLIRDESEGNNESSATCELKPDLLYGASGNDYSICSIPFRTVSMEGMIEPLPIVRSSNKGHRY